MKMDFDTFMGDIYQKDVNNYFLVDRETGAVKAKGAYVKKLSDLDYDLPTVNRAISEYFSHKTTPEETIMGCGDLRDFQKGCKSFQQIWMCALLPCYHYGENQGRKGRSKNVKRFSGGEVQTDKTFRVFASTDRSKGGLFKVSGKVVKGRKKNPEKFGNTPEHCFIINDDVTNLPVPDELDRQYYIDLAWKRLKDYGVDREGGDLSHATIQRICPDKRQTVSWKVQGKKTVKHPWRSQDLDEYAAILGDETILIDVDNAETSELLFHIVQDLGLKCRVYATTRGKHFYFRNPEGYVEKSWTKQTLALGIETDSKVGRNNSYAIMRFNGVDREIIAGLPGRWNSRPSQVVDPGKNQHEVLGYESRRRRNQALFNYILTLQSEDFTKEEARETIRMINRYVLEDPLSDRELETILRDDAFKKPIFFKDKTFLFDKFAVYLKNNNHIVKINNQLHIYRDGIYVPGAMEIEAQMIKHIPNPKTGAPVRGFSLSWK